MKLDAFYFRLLEKLRGYRCRGCGKALDKTLRITFDARPDNEWEIMAECRSCGEDYRREVGVTQMFANGPKKLTDFPDVLD